MLEFEQDLGAGAAREDWLSGELPMRPAGNSQRSDMGLAKDAVRREEGHPLGTKPGGIGRILLIGPEDDTPVGQADGRPDRKTGIGRITPPHRLYRHLYEITILRRQFIGRRVLFVHDFDILLHRYFLSLHPFLTLQK